MYGTQDILALFYRIGPTRRFPVADLVGAGRNHTHWLRELVDRLSQRLVLTSVASSCGAGALAREPI